MSSTNIENRFIFACLELISKSYLLICEEKNILICIAKGIEASSWGHWLELFTKKYCLSQFIFSIQWLLKFTIFIKNVKFGLDKEKFSVLKLMWKVTGIKEFFLSTSIMNAKSSYAIQPPIFFINQDFHQILKCFKRIIKKDYKHYMIITLHM